MTVALRGEEREVALAEVDAVRAAVQDAGYRERLDGLREAIEDDGVADPDELAELAHWEQIGFIESGQRLRLPLGRSTVAAW